MTLLKTKHYDFRLFEVLVAFVIAASIPYLSYKLWLMPMEI